MRYLFTLFMLLLVAKVSYGQTTIKLEDVSKVCGKVDDIRYMEQAKNNPTVININVPNTKKKYLVRISVVEQNT